MSISRLSEREFKEANIRGIARIRRTPAYVYLHDARECRERERESKLARRGQNNRMYYAENFGDIPVCGILCGCV